MTGPSSCSSRVESHRARLAEAGLVPGAAPPVDDEQLEELRSTRSALARDLIEQAGARCRGSSQAYLEAVNQLQRADAYDPYLHREWGLTLRVRGGRDAEAEQHIAVAATLFEQALGALAAGLDVAGPQMMPGGHALTAGALRRELAATRALLAPAHAPGATRRGDEL